MTAAAAHASNPAEDPAMAITDEQRKALDRIARRFAAEVRAKRPEILKPRTERSPTDGPGQVGEDARFDRWARGEVLRVLTAVRAWGRQHDEVVAEDAEPLSPEKEAEVQSQVDQMFEKLQAMPAPAPRRRRKQEEPAEDVAAEAAEFLRKARAKAATQGRRPK